ncbi:hypothetical protein [Butyricimonas paravirosa]|uniref:hypothetical protein n=1 Tax=Butyricimonas paravirosa TaxID=1472417 RepID=UPI0022E4DAC2|nr:hypothetical protein [Butyricimonas paravirosa]
MRVKVFLLFFSLLSIPGVGATRCVPVEEVSDSVRVFRFVPCRATFYVHFGSNDVELDSILSMAKRYQEDIEAGRIMLQLDSYSTSLSTDEENLNLALLRANEVKKAIAWRRRLTDRCFVVHTHPTLLENTREVVTVRLLVKVGEKQGKNVALSEVQDPKKAKVRDQENSSVLSENDVVMLPLASAEVLPVVKL